MHYVHLHLPPHLARRVTVALLLSVASVLFSTSAAGQELSGIPGAFVDVGYGARPVAMGSAYVGLADGPFSIQWNPAGMAHHDSTKIAFSYIDQMGLFEYQHLAGSYPFGDNYGIGLAAVSTGNEAYRELTVEAGIAGSYRAWTVGLGIKYRNASYGNNTLSPDNYAVFEPNEIEKGISNQVSGSANGFGLDLGVMYRPDPRVSVGLRVRDLIAPMQWNSEVENPNLEARGSYVENIPTEVALGTAYFVRENVVITTDYVPALLDGTVNKIRVGGEATLLEVISLRGGIEQRINDRSDEKYSLGFGINVPIRDELYVKADYTYRFEQINSTQHITLSVSF